MASAGPVAGRGASTATAPAASGWRPAFPRWRLSDRDPTAAVVRSAVDRRGESCFASQSWTVALGGASRLGSSRKHGPEPGVGIRRCAGCAARGRAERGRSAVGRGAVALLGVVAVRRRSRRRAAGQRGEADPGRRDRGRSSSAGGELPRTMLVWGSWPHKSARWRRRMVPECRPVTPMQHACAGAARPGRRGGTRFPR